MHNQGSLRSGLCFLPHMPKVGAIINRQTGMHEIITGEYYSLLNGYRNVGQAFTLAAAGICGA